MPLLDVRSRQPSKAEGKNSLPSQQLQRPQEAGATWFTLPLQQRPWERSMVYFSPVLSEKLNTTKPLRSLKAVWQVTGHLLQPQDLYNQLPHPSCLCIHAILPSWGAREQDNLRKAALGAELPRARLWRRPALRGVLPPALVFPDWAPTSFSDVFPPHFKLQVPQRLQIPFKQKNYHFSGLVAFRGAATAFQRKAVLLPGVLAGSSQAHREATGLPDLGGQDKRPSHPRKAEKPVLLPFPQCKSRSTASQLNRPRALRREFVSVGWDAGPAVPPRPAEV